MPLDPVDLSARLIRCPSVTPAEGGALELLESELSAAGFDCTRVDRNGTPNLFARWGRAGHPRTLGFNGHTDVVPVGDAAAWTRDPFGGAIEDGVLWGRGATDMKTGVAAWVAAAVDFVTATPPDGALIVTITGDEEGSSTDGTIALLDWMREAQERMTACIVGEPTCPETFGDMIKIGRRGAMTVTFTVSGEQGHSAYPHRARNPVTALARLIDRLASHRLDEGTGHFDPSTLAPVTFDVGNPASNVIPSTATARVNIRFNDTHTSSSLTTWLKAEANAVAKDYGVGVEMTVQVSGESFLTPPGELSALVSDAVKAESGVVPVLSTTGGTSDARFVKDHCPVVEFGLVGKTMHQVDERIEIDQIHKLKQVYLRIMQSYFA